MRTADSTPEFTDDDLKRPIQSVGNLGWEPRPLQLTPLRWSPPGPWAPDDPEAFMRGWMVEGREDSNDVLPCRAK